MSNILVILWLVSLHICCWGGSPQKCKIDNFKPLFYHSLLLSLDSFTDKCGLYVVISKKMDSTFFLCTFPEMVFYGLERDLRGSPLVFEWINVPTTTPETQHSFGLLHTNYDNEILWLWKVGFNRKFNLTDCFLNVNLFILRTGDVWEPPLVTKSNLHIYLYEPGRLTRVTSKTFTHHHKKGWCKWGCMEALVNGSFLHIYIDI